MSEFNVNQAKIRVAEYTVKTELDKLLIDMNKIYIVALGSGSTAIHAAKFIDEIDEKLNAIKGGGGCLTLEKIVAYTSHRVAIMADSRKLSKKLGDNYFDGIPIEIIPSSHRLITKIFETEYFDTCNLRMGVKKQGPVITDNGNFILDWKFKHDYDWKFTESDLQIIPGIVEVGIFPSKYIDVAYICNVENYSISTLYPNE
ncbi:hypothetical protein A3Q56_01289 [Intoshia linei]|uniref:ribose-5-phosphate isomerase n=1 Tax=Intoshia linei TaxID=1819745 RepID=A0A177B9L9_9BILA|nr:hypothetical protein A3Q56_01289 [Intoshia linei]